LDNLHPLRQFTWRLLLLLGLGAVLLVTVASQLVDRAFVGDTVAATQAAVETHFARIFPAALLTMPSHSGPASTPQPAAGDPYAAYGSYGGYDSDASMPGMPGMAAAPAGNALDGLVRMHFGLYDIVLATFYDTAGEVTYSYQPGLVGTVASGQTQQRVQAALQGSAGVHQEPFTSGTHRVQAVHLFVPIRARDGGSVMGVAEVVRDMTTVRANIRTLELAITGLMLLIAGLLFFSLRRVYGSSTDAIRSRSQALAQALHEVQETYDATLRALSGALDLRDSETEIHSLRVTAYADHLAARVGVGEAEREALRRGALLHDVGKIGVPDAILRKPGPLNDAEWQQMRRHPQIGAEMLAGIGFLHSAIPLVRHHHERWDGNGYPDRLVGEGIPLGARIFAIADTLDAMTSDRPYRAAKSFAEARAEIARCMGSQFDPQVVEAFLATPESEWTAIARAVREAPAGQRTA